MNNMVYNRIWVSEISTTNKRGAFMKSFCFLAWRWLLRFDGSHNYHLMIKSLKENERHLRSKKKNGKLPVQKKFHRLARAGRGK
jgi:hypothetical protein